MYIQALVIVVLLGKLMKRVFFGQLRAAEVEVHIQMVLSYKYLSKTNQPLCFVYSI